MAADRLPDEIMAEIFKFTGSGYEVFRCRRVCRRWRDVVNNLPDSFWQSRCCMTSCNNIEKSYITSAEYSKARKKYGLTWRGVYKALNAWDRIVKLPMNVRQPNSFTNINGFQVLPNSIIALYKNLRHSSGVDDEYPRPSDTIVYYNLEINEECGIEEYNFLFSDYEEYKDIVILHKADRTGICIVTKKDKVQHYFEGDFKSAVFDDNEIYLYTNNSIMLINIEEHDGKNILKKEMLPDPLGFDIYSLSKIGEKLYVFSEPLSILVFSDNKFEIELNPEMDDLDEYADANSRFVLLNTYGFRWTSPDIFKSFYTDFPDDNPGYWVFYEHIRSRLLICNEWDSPVTNIVHIPNYSGCVPYDLSQCDIKRKVDLSKEITEYAICEQYVTKLDIAETETHHRILVLAKNGLHVVELQYSVSGSQNESLTPIIKRLKTEEK